MRLFALLFAAVTLASAQLAPPKVLILLGPPGSGKSVQAHYLSKKYGIPSISVAELLGRGMGRKNRTSRGLAVGIESGDLLNDEGADDLVIKTLMEIPVSKGFILDGFPTTAAQAKVFDQFLKEQGYPKPMVLLLEANDDVVRGRMIHRKRADDQPGNIERRIAEFHQRSQMLEQWYTSENLIRVDATGPIKTVSSLIDQGLQQAGSSRGFASRP